MRLLPDADHPRTAGQTDHHAPSSTPRTYHPVTALPARPSPFQLADYSRRLQASDTPRQLRGHCPGTAPRRRWLTRQPPARTESGDGLVTVAYLRWGCTAALEVEDLGEGGEEGGGCWTPGWS
jgi:hypothetical protein